MADGMTMTDDTTSAQLTKPLAGKVAFVTGSGRGLGRTRLRDGWWRFDGAATEEGARTQRDQRTAGHRHG